MSHIAPSHLKTCNRKTVWFGGCCVVGFFFPFPHKHFGGVGTRNSVTVSLSSRQQKDVETVKIRRRRQYQRGTITSGDLPASCCDAPFPPEVPRAPGQGPGRARAPPACPCSAQPHQSAERTPARGGNRRPCSISLGAGPADLRKDMVKPFPGWNPSFHPPRKQTSSN